ncbi:Mur ligase family protein, partial [Erysipelothrix rhusiopathiae]|nr:Mur ligase family protein [Erysipelothrix rhusiopathiae]
MIPYDWKIKTVNTFSIYFNIKNTVSRCLLKFCCTNFEIDHVDYFKSVEDYLSAFKEFAKNVESLIVVWGDDPHYQ